MISYFFQFLFNSGETMSDEIQPAGSNDQGLHNINIEDEMSSSYIDYSMITLIE